ncbi:MAG: MFS transporter, partial [Microbacterium sp.]|nr:MFS transporter [Microbacterium sp.]
LFLKQIPLSDQAGLVARGEAITGEEAEKLEAELRARPTPGAHGDAPDAPSGSDAETRRSSR